MPRFDDKPWIMPSDLENLRASGLTDETIFANGLYTELEKYALARILQRRYNPETCKGGLVFPYRNLAGEVNCFGRIRPHFPQVKDGKPVKYIQPLHTTPRAYFPHASLPHLRDSTAPVYITEGEKKALALSQLGLAAIGIGGIYCWKIAGTENLIADLAAIQWQGRVVYIVFDYDQKHETRAQTSDASRRLAWALQKVGAKEVLLVELPPGPDEAKQGVDDFLVANGEQAFRKLVEQAKAAPDEIVAGRNSLLHLSGRTDSANAARLVAKFGDVIRWVGPWDKWLLWWDGQRWKTDDALRIVALAKEVASDLWEEAATLAKSPGIDKDTIKAVFGFVHSSNNACPLRNMVALARSDIPIGVDELDRDPWLLNVVNGTLDLKTGKLRPHCRQDFITKLAPVVFDPAATCPHWSTFLETILAGKAGLIGYMQRLVGYCLTGDTSEHVLPFLYGTGSNGKSTFIETLLSLLGPDYGMKAPRDLLMARQGERHPTELADLHGKRFVAAVETEEGRRLAETLVKELTGGDTVKARRMREDFWSFSATHKLWFAGNHKPVIIGTDHGIWRRIKLIPFEVVIPDDRQDKQLKQKLAAELPGILNWALAGCLQWQQGGMQEPEAVSNSTRAYQTDSDEVGQFIADRCEVGEGFVAIADDLWKAFDREVPDSGLTQRAFGDRLRQHGFTNRDPATGKDFRPRGRRSWRGLRLRTVVECI